MANKTETISARIDTEAKRDFHAEVEKLGFKPTDVLVYLVKTWTNDSVRMAAHDLLSRSSETASLMLLLKVNLSAMEQTKNLPSDVVNKWADLMHTLKEHISKEAAKIESELKSQMAKNTVEA